MTRMTAFSLKTKLAVNHSLHSGPQKGCATDASSNTGWPSSGSSWTVCVHWSCKGRRYSHPPITIWPRRPFGNQN